MTDLAQSWSSPEELIIKFEPSGQTIRNLVHQAARYESLRHDGLNAEKLD